MLNVFIWKGFIKSISKARVSEQLFNIYIYIFFSSWQYLGGICSKTCCSDAFVTRPAPVEATQHHCTFPRRCARPCWCWKLPALPPSPRSPWLTQGRVRALLRAAEFGSRGGFGLWWFDGRSRTTEECCQCLQSTVQREDLSVPCEDRVTASCQCPLITSGGFWCLHYCEKVNETFFSPPCYQSFTAACLMSLQKIPALDSLVTWLYLLCFF